MNIKDNISISFENFESKEAIHDDYVVGPVPLNNVPVQKTEYGPQLMHEEGSAMAEYIQSGKRIPRRGEIGLDSEQIQRFERAGYVMSGSRHQVINSVRERKEKQVISVENKKSLIQSKIEEHTKKENEIISKFKDMIRQKSDKFKDKY